MNHNGTRSYQFQLVGWFVGDRLQPRDFERYEIIFMNACVVITVSTVMISRDFGSCWIIQTPIARSSGP
jgi:diadenosine tetraphosphatase ApaH/serine/threonine PP2A family protein phosphatase